MIDLKGVITKYPDTINDGKKLKAILYDLYPQEKARTRCVVDILESGIVNKIKNGKEIDDLFIKSLCQTLEDEYGYSLKITKECIYIWTAVFNEDENLPQKITTVKKTPSKRVNVTKKSPQKAHEFVPSKQVSPKELDEDAIQIWFWISFVVGMIAFWGCFAFCVGAESKSDEQNAQMWFFISSLIISIWRTICEILYFKATNGYDLFPPLLFTTWIITFCTFDAWLEK